MSVRHYVYVIINPKTRKLLDEVAFNDESRALSHLGVFHPKGEVIELVVWK